jgi:hypothetical protein
MQHEAVCNASLRLRLRIAWSPKNFKRLEERLKALKNRAAC